MFKVTQQGRLDLNPGLSDPKAPFFTGAPELGDYTQKKRKKKTLKENPILYYTDRETEARN